MIKKGFTLIEILVVVGICAVVGLAVSNFGRDIFVQNYVVSKSLVAQSDANMAISRMMTELRRAQPASNGAYPIEAAASSTITFYSDVDNNGIRDRIRYWLEGKVLKRGVIRPTGQPYVYLQSNESIGTAANDLVNSNGLIFSYYDKNYDGTASSSPLSYPIDLKAVRLIKVELLIDANPTRSPAPLYLSSQVMLRNLKDNL